jgi:hypothetical protein
LDAAPVFEDACRHLVRQFEREAPCNPVYARHLARAYAMKESLEFGRERLARIRGQFLVSELRFRPGLAHPDAQNVPAPIVE